MTKRFTIDDSKLNLIDNNTTIAYTFDNTEDCENCCGLLNKLNDENEQLHQSIADWETSFDLLKQQLQNEHQMLENAILLERTRMGQNALKQYRDAIQ